MEVKIVDDLGLEEMLTVPTDESGFYQTIAERVSQLPFPNKISVTVRDKLIEYETQDRGGTCNIQEKKNNITFKIHSAYPKKYLTYADFISAEKKALEERGEVKRGNDYGSYKFYSLEQQSDGQIKASWGSMRGIGVPKSCTYPVSMFWIKYYEKIQKGYMDNSEAYIEDKDVKINEAPKKEEESKLAPKSSVPVNKLSQRLWTTLKQGAMNFIQQHFENKKNLYHIEITPGMVNKSQEYLDLLYKTENLEDFNNILLKLCMVCPRKVWDMKQLMAKTDADIPKILQREEDLVDAMKGMLLNPKKSEEKVAKKEDCGDPDPFKSIGVIISEISSEERGKILKMLPNDLKTKVKTIYKACKPEHEARFKDYVKKNGIKVTKLLWHGSRNENWLSIIDNGLLLKPNAKITGKMFGNGIYFAPSAQKSWGYTSYHGSYWAGGTSNLAFMGLYEVAYGDPYHPRSGENWQFTKSFLKNHKKDCVHAEGGSCGLRNDEIIFYDEAAMCLRYVVEFA